MSLQAVRCAAAARNTNPRSFQTFYEESHTTIYKIAYAMLKNEHDAWDATQNVYIKILVKADSLRDPDKMKNWMVTMTYNECKNMLKAQRRSLFRMYRDADISEMESFSDMESPELGPMDCLEAGEMKEELRTFLEQLPEEQRRTLLLYYYEQKSIEEIARVTGCSANTVKSRLNYGKKKMRSLIGDYEAKHHVSLRCSVLLPLLSGLFYTGHTTVAVVSSVAAAAAACMMTTSVLPSSLPTEPAISSTTTAVVAMAVETTTSATEATTAPVTTAAMPVAVVHTQTTTLAEALAFLPETTTTTVEMTTTAAEATTEITTESTWCWGDWGCWGDWHDWDWYNWCHDHHNHWPKCEDNDKQNDCTDREDCPTENDDTNDNEDPEDPEDGDSDGEANEDDEQLPTCTTPYYLREHCYWRGDWGKWGDCPSVETTTATETTPAGCYDITTTTTTTTTTCTESETREAAPDTLTE